MRLVVTSPSGIVVDAAPVRHVRAEDATGAFGLLPHHDDLLTALAISVVTWRDADDHEHHVAVRGGVLTSRGGELVEIATRDAQRGDDLDALEHDVITRFRAEAAETVEARAEAARLEGALVRHVLRYLQPRIAVPTFREEPEP